MVLIMWFSSGSFVWPCQGSTLVARFHNQCLMVMHLARINTQPMTWVVRCCAQALQSISLAEDRTKLDAQRAADSFASEFPLSPLATRQSTGTMSPFGAANASPELLAQLAAGLSGYAGGVSQVPDASTHSFNQILQAAQQLQALQQLGQAGSPSLQSINPIAQVPCLLVFYSLDPMLLFVAGLGGCLLMLWGWRFFLECG
jgi:hypothetical protein